MDIRDALSMARERGFDLIEVAPNANPPVCKLMDYGKFKYEQGRRDREAHKKQKTTEVKGIRLRPSTDEHDLRVKLKRMESFLKQGNKVKVTVIFRAREITHPEIARKSLDFLASETEEYATVEKAPSFEGRTMTMVVAPKPVTEKEKPKKASEAEASAVNVKKEKPLPAKAKAVKDQAAPAEQVAPVEAPDEAPDEATAASEER